MKLLAKDLSAVKTLQALYEATRPVGLGILQARPGGLSDKEATEFLTSGYPLGADSNHPGAVGFDYVAGRPLKVSILEKDGHTEVQRADLFDRDAGEGAAVAALKAAGASAVEVLEP